MTNEQKICRDCKKEVYCYYMGEWCEECFDEGLHKDMNDHFDRTIKNEMKELEESKVWGEKI